MRTHHPENERIKHRYQIWLREAKRQSEASVDKALAAIRQFELYNKCRPFKKFHVNQATGFKRHLTELRNEKTGKPLSAATLNSTLNALKAFFLWLADQAGYRQSVRYADTEYFNASEKDRAIATAKRDQPVPTPEQIRHVISSMPGNTAIEKRDRALIAFILLTGARDGAVSSMKLKHVDIDREAIFQDAREVRTKFAKTFTSYFFPVGDDIRAIVVDWIDYLRGEQLFGGDEPLFPKTALKVGASRKFEVAGLSRMHWSNTTPIRIVFRKAFAAVGLPYFHPHSFRNTLAQLGLTFCRGDNEKLKAWSQNLGHTNMLTTLTSYGTIDSNRQGVIMRQIAAPAEDRNQLIETLAETIEQLRQV